MKILCRSLLAGTVLMCLTVSAQETSMTGSFNETFKKSRFGASYFSFTGADVEAAENGFPTLSVYNYVSANYKFSKDQKISIRPVFQFETPGYDSYGIQKKADTYLGDLHLSYSNYSIALLPGDWELSGQAKLYFPTSESAQEKKILTYVKGELISEKLLRHGWIVQYTVKPGYWFHSQRSYRDVNEYERKDGSTVKEISSKANKWGELEHYVGIGKYINSIFTPKFELGFNHEWSYTSEFAERSYASSNMLKLAPSTEIHVARKLWFVLGIENTIELNDTRIAANDWKKANGQSIKLFEPRDTQYYLMTFLSL